LTLSSGGGSCTSPDQQGSDLHPHRLPPLTADPYGMASGPATGPGFWPGFCETAAWWWGEGRGCAEASRVREPGRRGERPWRRAATRPQELVRLEGEGFGDGRCLMQLASSEGEDGRDGGRVLTRSSVGFDDARLNPPAARRQQGPVLMRANAGFYNSYPWGAAFCTLSPAQRLDDSTARPW
jgi:hypothetical protein